jgi:hypothetical protein
MYSSVIGTSLLLPARHIIIPFHKLRVLIGMHRISVWPDNPAFFDIRYLAGYQIAPPDIR